MKNIFFNILALFVLFTCTIFSCKKESPDSSAPVINIFAPVENQFVSVFDTLTVTCEINADKHLESASITLVNDNLIPVQSSVNINVSSNFISASLPYIIYDIHLTSGVYYIRVNASDGPNTVNNYRKINVTAVPEKLMVSYFITNPNANNMLVSLLDSDFVATSAYFNFGGDYSSSAISNYNQEIYTSGLYTGCANAISLETPNLKWSITPIIGSNPYFEDIINKDKTTYIAYYSGLIRGLSSSGSTNFNANISSGYYPLKIFKHENYVACAEKYISGPSKKIILFNATTGAGMQETILTQDVIKFFSKDTDNIFAFGNSAGQGVIEIYQITTNGFWTPHTLTPGTILSAEQIDADTYLIGHSNGNIYKYIYSTNSSTPFITGVIARTIKYDIVNQQVVVTTGANIKQYNYVNAALITSVTVADSVFDIHILYNH